MMADMDFFFSAAIGISLTPCRVEGLVVLLQCVGTFGLDMAKTSHSRHWIFDLLFLLSGFDSAGLFFLGGL